MLFEQILSSVISFTASNGLRLLIILTLFLFGKGILKILVRKFIIVLELTGKTQSENQIELQQRLKTLTQIITATGNILIYSIIFLMLLEILGVDIKPILTGAGILGLAVGFGAQTLVKDLVSGLFILIENQFTIGDKIKSGSFEGEVVKMTMRLTVLEDDEKNIYYLSNSALGNVINLSRNKSQK